MTTGALRLAWEAVADVPADASLRVTLHSSISGRPLQTVVDMRGSGSDTVRFADDPRVSYLLVESEGVAWRLTLEEAVARRP